MCGNMFVFLILSGGDVLPLKTSFPPCKLTQKIYDVENPAFKSLDHVPNGNP
jgi:hypothetical protein